MNKDLCGRRSRCSPRRNQGRKRAFGWRHPQGGGFEIKAAGRLGEDVITRSAKEPLDDIELGLEDADEDESRIFCDTTDLPAEATPIPLAALELVRFQAKKAGQTRNVCDGRNQNSRGAVRLAQPFENFPLEDLGPQRAAGGCNMQMRLAAFGSVVNPPTNTANDGGPQWTTEATFAVVFRGL